MTSEQEQHDDKLVVVYRASSSQQASILKVLLNDFDIDCEIDGGALEGGAGELPIGWASAPRVRVFKNDVDAAKKIIADFEEGKFSEAENDWMGVDYADGGYDWPECPQCHESQYAHCPRCNFVGIDFEAEQLFNVQLDEMGVASDQPGDKFLLLCPVCNEKSPPEFVDRCRICKFEFEDAKLASDAPAASADYNLPETGSINLPTILVGLLLLILLVLGGLYFVLL